MMFKIFDKADIPRKKRFQNDSLPADPIIIGSA